MATALVNGVTLHYETLGDGPAIVLTPGPGIGELLRPLAERLAERYQVLIWDRRNVGASDISLNGDGSLSDICMSDLHALIQHLGVAPAVVGGSSWGCGLSLLMAVHHPEDVRSLLLWAVGGGSPAATERINYQGYGQYIEAAERGGMEEVAQLDRFAASIAQNPGNRDRLLAMNPADFITTMTRWRGLNIEGARTFVAPGLTEDQIHGITVPAIIVPGSDDAHSAAAAERLHGLLPGSTYVPDPIGPMSADLAARLALAAQLAPLFLAFLGQASVT